MWTRSSRHLRLFERFGRHLLDKHRNALDVVGSIIHNLTFVRGEIPMRASSAVHEVNIPPSLICEPSLQPFLFSFFFGTNTK